MREDFSQRLEDVEETIHARLWMQQGCIENLQNGMHINEVDKEILKTQWTRGDEAKRSFVGRWFQMSKEDVDTFSQQVVIHLLTSQPTSKVKLNDYNKTLSGTQPTIR
ncbi:hypothetical protein DY000_02004558 [Brassica cretica]|uniref:Uncharacterized protein n=1 Tax=Brassica cretica TaxID=69181 RepID=A0ABQ7BSR2_BRACR|nr:hypothetical protein DY000_02004558 [Brassica cretica]